MTHHESYPEIGRALKAAAIRASEEGRSWTPYRRWQVLKGLRARHGSIAKKDPKERDPAAERSHGIVAALAASWWEEHA